MLPLIAAGLPIAYQFGMGLLQNSKANGMHPVRPEYQIPTAVTENVAMARMNANSQRMPGQALAEENLRAQQAAGMRSAGMMGGPNALAAMTAMTRNTQNQQNQLSAQAQAWQDKNRGVLMQQLNTLAGYQDKKWDWNQRQKFMEDAAAKAALKQAGLNNIYQGVAGIGQMGVMGMMGMFKPTGAGAVDPMTARQVNLNPTSFTSGRPDYIVPQLPGQMPASYNRGYTGPPSVLPYINQ
jgi:hypothetical protein